MQRLGYSYGAIEYKTASIPTMGASNDSPHQEMIKRVNDAKKKISFK